ncbi:S26 family signal peptidase [Actinomadura nitritigenes]|uniref:S26 family signal peptidase n=1 Tax=Actinomadura nitritigenes TaxID=134602 RepID=A0ABS3QSZ2_9ACTN|nr:S26 family signal peptidase [Actinomadura nitritigenes]MBO2436598.1 S26 family signal peptidase [Actinomadura nitritigenes]
MSTLGWPTAAVLGVLGVAAAVGALVLLLRRRFTVVEVYGTSMVPTLAPGDRLLVRRTGLARVDTDRLVVLEGPYWREFGPGAPADLRWIVKRAAAVPGEPVPAPVRKALPSGAGAAVPEGRLAVLGDNPAQSVDSRHFGLLPADALLGVVVRRLR